MQLNVTKHTIGNYLKKLVFSTRVAARKPLINLRNTKLRLNWAKDNCELVEEDWESVGFTDESTFEINNNYNKGKKLVKRKINTRYKDKHVVKFESQSNIKRNFFGVMLYNEPVKLFECTDEMNSDEFKSMFFDRLIPAFLDEDIDLKDYILQFDNAGIHNDCISELKSED